MRTRVKFCGFTNIDDAHASVELGIDALGFVFYSDSKRFISPVDAGKIIQTLPPFVVSVGLFVNASLVEVQKAHMHARFTCLQFHGGETPEQCAQIAENLRLPFIKAVPVDSKIDLNSIEASFSAVSTCFQGLLLDTPSGSYGGAGLTFDWSVIKGRYNQNNNCKFILAGGLTSQNIGAAITMVRPYAVDVSSGIESSHGKKNLQKMTDFMNAVKSL